VSLPAGHGLSEASSWVQRWSHLLLPGATVLDVACGSGRHLAWFARRGHAVTGIDINIQAAAASVSNASLIQADIENGPWPLKKNGAPEPFGAVVVTNYLWRPLMPTLLASLAPGGVLLYETFAAGNETVGRPRNPDFLLRPGELLALCNGLHVVAYEHGFLDQPARYVQRIAALRNFTPAQSVAEWARHAL
jgi:SAM-dependent methyltransferase